MRSRIERLELTDRIRRLKKRTVSQRRFLSLEQAAYVTESYRCTEAQPKVLRRAHALAHVLRNISIAIDLDEIIVGNRAAAARAGVVFPEASVAWLDREIETLPTREQDTFEVRPQDVARFRGDILPYWRGKTLEDAIERRRGDAVREIARVVKINQKDHAQGHIIPNIHKWLELGPAGLLDEARSALNDAGADAGPFYQSVVIVLDAACDFIGRYADLADRLSRDVDAAARENLISVSRVCRRLSRQPPHSFREAVQSVWFLFVLLHMESNASSFSPGRLDQYLFPWLERDLESGRIDIQGALETLEALWVKFNQIIYMRNAQSARYFAGFPIGFNVCIGGQTPDGDDATNPLSYLCLAAQEHLGLPQPNLSARLHEGSPDEFLDVVTRVIGRGSGMPQVFNDESIVPALVRLGVSRQDALDYGVVGCVELSAQGNALGWSDAAMLNLVKTLELALNNGRCLLTGELLGPETGDLATYSSFDELERAFGTQLDFFMRKMIDVCGIVDRAHAEVLPSPLLSSVIDDCLARGLDVTAGGAHYNFSGVQAIQVANVADSLAALKQCVYEERSVSAGEMLEALRRNYAGDECLCTYLRNRVPKYGNDVAWVDALGGKWARRFAEKLAEFSNARGGPYHAGFYTVSAHMPMGKNVGATPDGRRAGEPLADGGLSPVYGRDEAGPTAVLQSVSRIPPVFGSNGTLLNMKFLPAFFSSARDRRKFAALLRGLVSLKIHHTQFNVIKKEDLLRAKAQPDEYRHLTVRVAGYTAYFVELAEDLQDEIIARTTHGP